MRIISPLLKHVVYPGLSRSGYLRRSARGGPVVLTYHGILPEGYAADDPALDGHLIAAHAFRRQLRLLKSKYNVISPEQFLLWCDGELDLPPRAVLLTCDDGLLNTLTDMLPIVREFDVPFLIFVTGASLSDQSAILWYEQLYLWFIEAGEKFSLRLPWVPEGRHVQGRVQTLSLWQELIRKLSALDAGARAEGLQDVRTQLGISHGGESEYAQNEAKRRRFLMLNVTELRKVANAGMSIGAHTLTHPMLSQMPADMAFQEISLSRVQLGQALGREVWALAFPFGGPDAVSGREPELARRAGFKCAFVNMESNTCDRFVFPRIHVSAGMNIAEFEAHVSGFYRSIRERDTQVEVNA
jgi:peptidoglycan/xylan/chitin deacetylase (PgdA/CDA1 family)